MVAVAGAAAIGSGWSGGRPVNPLFVSLLGRLPMLRRQVRAWTQSVFLHQLTAMMRSGISVEPALGLCAGSLDAGPAGRDVLAAAEAVGRGEGVRDALARIAFLPAGVRLLFNSPADDVQLYGFLDEFATQADEDLRRNEDLFRENFQATVVIFLGVTVGTALASFWGTYFLALTTVAT
jgi:type II secretory pathway component PulF